MAKTLSELMSDKFDSLQNPKDVIDKAKEEIDKLKIKGVSTKIITKKKISKSDMKKVSVLTVTSPMGA